MGAMIFITTIVYVWFIKSDYFNDFRKWSLSNILLFSTVLILLKIISIVWPPIPGGLITISAIPLVGWQNAYFSDLIGSVLGSSITYFLGKKYGYKLLNRLFDEKVIEKIKKIKIKKSKELEAIFTLRILTGSLFMEAITYGAGVLRIGFSNFLIATVISHLLVGVPSYFLFAQISTVGFSQTWLVNVALFAIAFFVMYKLKGRYFE